MINANNTKQKTLCTLIFVVFCTLFSTLHAQSKGSFNIRNHFENEGRLVFNYYAPFPGMTKVKLFDADGTLVWRGQYIDKEGDNELRLRSAALSRGESYVFQFEYKMDMVRIPVTLN